METLKTTLYIILCFLVISTGIYGLVLSINEDKERVKNLKLKCIEDTRVNGSVNYLEARNCYSFQRWVNDY